MPLRLRHAFSLALLLTGATAAHAQSPGATPPAPPSTEAADPRVGPLLLPNQRSSTIYTSYKSYLAARYANDREAQAAIHMFGRKQTGSLVWLLGGGGAIGYLASQTGTTKSGSGTRTFTISPLGYTVFIGLVGGISAGKIARFNNSRLYEALKEYDQTHSFPDYVNAKVKDKDYR
ncbi:hypothetical protein [Hymenobacter ruricola]|uniref:Uncharacterized protein n=1 Tax=Hymenobacter ruricola TaxID=2791023 RepID=A0ABS0I7Z4_9BACT|nr:hypothetical protein [Hymenobacter ruricola]MBF9222644.1 hypothetical protein [Hymenobacter ruricola]